MSSHKARWLALTSHHKWVFFRLHPDEKRPYITHSNVEVQEDNTRLFRAFLAMMLVTALGHGVESHANIVPLPPLQEHDDVDDNDGGDDDTEYDPDRHEDGSSEGAREEPPLTRQMQRRTRTSADLLVRQTPVLKVTDTDCSV